ncbi:hypothetical protein [Flavobacterium sp. 14A]|uniref:hypothetical protein n=1 Tax=Flavobacterium sp. 14A TaxID=2735896 RepID=UPI0015706718|nr:hypothetical protein [Flavobacterium sp. 14A]NRT11532.1 hypothetical protein [Flavobacterium sp. 14A]
MSIINITVDENSSQKAIDAAKRAEDAVVDKIWRGAVSPTDPTPTEDGVYLPKVSGTYPNHGGKVADLNNQYVLFTLKKGVWTVINSLIDLSLYAKKTDISVFPTWTAKAYLIGEKVSYNGKFWKATSATLSTDVPATSSKWLDELSGKVNTEALKSELLKFSDKLDKERGLNLFDSSEKKDGFVINSDGTLSSSIYSYGVSGKIKISLGDVLTSNFICSATRKAVLFDVNDNPIVSSIVTTYVNGVIQIAYQSNASYAIFGYNISDSNFQVVKGTINLPYEKYTNFKSINLLNSNVSVLENTKQNKVYSNNLVNTNTLVNGFDLNISDGSFSTPNINKYTTDKIYVEPNKSYTLSGSGNIKYVEYGELDKVVYGEDISKLKTRVTSEFAKYIRLACSNVLSNVQFENGSVKTVYTPFKEYTIKDTVLPSIDYIPTFNYVDKNNFVSTSAIDTDGNIKTGLYTVSKDLIRAKPSTLYSANSVGKMILAEFDVNGVWLRNSDFGASKIYQVTTLSNTYYIRYEYRDSPIGNFKYNFQIIEGSEPAIFKEFSLGSNLDLKHSKVVKAVPYMNNEMLVPSFMYVRPVQTRIDTSPFLKRELKTVCRVEPYDKDTLRPYKDYFLINKSNSLNISIERYDEDFNIVEVKKSRVEVANMSLNNGALKIATIGASLSSSSSLWSSMLSQCPSTSTVGTMRSDMNNALSPNIEGRPGWTFEYYFTLIHSPSTFGGFSPFLHPSDYSYKYYGCTRAWISAYANSSFDGGLVPKAEEIGGFNPTTGVKLIPNTNDVMYFYSENNYKKWNGSSWEIIAESVLNFTFDYSRYLTVWNISTPDIAILLVGNNDYSRVNINELEPLNISTVARFNQFITSVRIANPLMKICISLVPLFSDDHNLLADFGSYKNRCMFEMRRVLLSSFDNRINEKIYVVDIASSLNNDTDRAKNSDGYIIDSIHPSSYTNMSNMYAAFIQKRR